jgi:hypothetical protein
MAVSPIRNLAEQAAARARTTAGQIRGIAGYTDPALANIATQSGMVPGSYTAEMAGNVPYQSELLAGDVEGRIGSLRNMTAEMPRLINSYRLWKAEQDKKSGSGGSGGSVVMPTTPEVLGDYGKYLNVDTPVPSITRIQEDFNRPYQYTAPNIPAKILPVTKYPMSNLSATYKRMLETRAKK